MPATQSKTKSVYALIGEDSFLQIENLNRIAANLPADAARVDFDGERAELAEVLDELRSFAMFGGGGKLVTIRNADDFIARYREQLEDYLEKPSDSATLVLRVTSLPKNQRIYKSIAKMGEAIECEPPKPAQLPAWISTRAKSTHKITLAPTTANQLAELVGGDLGRLDNELAKIAVMCGGKPTIQPSDIEGCVAFQREQELKEMTRELAIGQPAKALQRWRQLLLIDSSAEFRAITWLSMWLEDVGVVVNNGNTSKLGWKYSDALPLFFKTARAMGKTGHARAVDLLTEMDRRTKSGLGDAPGNVERFILSFTTQGTPST